MRPLEYRELFQTSEVMDHNMEMTKRDGKVAGRLIFKTQFIKAKGDDSDSSQTGSSSDDAEDLL